MKKSKKPAETVERRIAAGIESIRLAEAIDVVHATEIHPGKTRPRGELEMQMVVIARAGAALRAFQRAGISSSEVAERLRSGVLVATPRSTDAQPNANRRATGGAP